MKESIKTIDQWGNQIWKNKAGQCHRDGDLPAIVWFDGAQWWYKDSKCHRIYGPAAVWPDGPDGYKEWSINLMISY